jgi:hypothetical protein
MRRAICCVSGTFMTRTYNSQAETKMKKWQIEESVPGFHQPASRLCCWKLLCPTQSQAGSEELGLDELTGRRRRFQM